MPEAESRPPHIPDYDLLRRVGSGSYGDVWIARGITGAHRAIKVVWRDRFTDLKPFEREFRGVKLFAGLSIKEPRLLSVFHVGRNEDAGFFYYVMEHADDVTFGTEFDPYQYQPRTLTAPTHPDARLPVQDTIRLGIDLAEALAVLHAGGLVHRDLKPANVVYVAGVPKLADIGLIALTGAHSYVGTDGYVAPEGPGTPAADVFSLGRVLYELATGLNRRDYPRLPPDVDRSGDGDALLELMAVLNRACARNADQRHPNAQALLVELRVLLAGRSVRRLRTAERSLRNTLRVAALLGIVATFGLAGALAENRRASAANIARRWAVYAGMIARVQHAIDNHDLIGARALLGRPEATQPPQPPGLELELAARPMDRRPAPNPPPPIDGAVDEVRFAPDGRSVAALDLDGNLRIQIPASAALHLPGIRQIGDFSPDATGLLAIDARGVLGRIALPDARFTPFLDRPLGLAAASPAAGIVCLTNSFSNCRFEIWRIPAPPLPPQHLFDIPEDPELRDVFATAVDPSGQFLAFGRFISGGTRQCIDVWSLAEGRRVARIATESEAWTLALSPSGDRLAAAFDSGEVRLADPRTGVTLARIPTNAGRPVQVAFSPDGTRFLCVGSGGILVVGDGTGTRSSASPPHLVASLDGLRGAHWTPDGREILTCDRQGRIARWNVDPPPDHRHHSAPVALALARIAVSPDARHLAVTAGPDTIDLLDTASGQRTQTFEGGFRPLCFTPDGALAGLDASFRLKLWDLRTGAELWRSPDPAPAVTSIADAGDGRHAALAGTDGSLVFWDLANRRILFREPPAAPATLCSALVGGHRLRPSIAGGTAHGGVWAWSPGVTGLQRFQLPGPGPVSALALAPGAGDLRLAAVQGTHGLTVLDLARPGSLPNPRPLPNRQVFAAAFTPDGERLLLGGSSGIIEFYETRQWTDVGTCRLPDTAGPGNRRPIALVIEPAGGLLATLLANGSAQWWTDLATLRHP